MDKNCNSCFFREGSVNNICGDCRFGNGGDSAHLFWVAVDFLKNVPDDEASIEGEEVMSQMAEQLLQSGAKDLALGELSASASAEWDKTQRAFERRQSKPQKPESALDKQVSGGHYKALKIQPIEFLHANNIPFAEGCAIKYLCRWRDKGGIKDLEKAKHFIELLIELEERVQ
jgi:hypothetical protein